MQEGRRPPKGEGGELASVRHRRRRLARDGRPGGGADAEDARLLARVADGDDGEALVDLYRRYETPLYRLGLRLLKDEGMAEELVQDTFVRLWRTAARFDPARGSATAWVSTIAHHRAVDRVRSERAATDRMRRVAAQAGELPYDEVFDETIVGLEHQQVRRCLRTLTPLQREAITLAYYRGYTYREAADRLGIGLPTVKTRMRDGLIRLRDCLGVSIG